MTPFGLAKGLIVIISAAADKFVDKVLSSPKSQLHSDRHIVSRCERFVRLLRNLPITDSMSVGSYVNEITEDRIGGKGLWNLLFLRPVGVALG